jgi:crotonobetainyl-CoA:carnitine CoA-transferase CaiB-like acyl-CoA transferase
VRVGGPSAAPQEFPLNDIRVLAIEQYGAGPFATSQLVDLGAEVIKIEDPTTGGDVGRTVPPFVCQGSSLFFETFNRGKRSVLLDLENVAGREVFEGLVACSDIVFANVRGDVPAKLGLRYQDLSLVNEKVVCCFLTAYGMASSEQQAPGYDYVMQGRAGWMSLAGEPEGAPQKAGLSLVDYSTGLAAAIAMVAGVHAARRTGRGSDCDLALFDTAIGMLSYVGTWYLTAGYLPVRTKNSAHPSLIPFQNFQTNDGWVSVACAKEKFWVRLLNVLGRADLASDPRYKNFALRKKHAATLLPELDDCFRQRTTLQWTEVLTSAGVPCGPVNDVAQALADPLVTERRMIVETQHPRLGTVRQLGGLARVGDFRPVDICGPLLGEHTEQVLGELLGVDAGRFAELERAGAFGAGMESAGPDIKGPERKDVEA